ncbi:MAG: hypothetical protein U5K43_04995 [Halofilum sp. (in: g-proteobacteria)]|nr:hypothetical protein [Halofilum sp. (in: g-proteobacteria)]
MLRDLEARKGQPGAPSAVDGDSRVLRPGPERSRGRGAGVSDAALSWLLALALALVLVAVAAGLWRQRAPRAGRRIAPAWAWTPRRGAGHRRCSVHDAGRRAVRRTGGSRPRPGPVALPAPRAARPVRGRGRRPRCALRARRRARRPPRATSREGEVVVAADAGARGRHRAAGAAGRSDVFQKR